MNQIELVTRTLSTDMNLAERVGYAGRMLLVGMLAVFAVLTIIWGVLALSRIFLGGMSDKKKEEPKPAAPAVPAAPVAPVAPAAPAGNDAATVAAITAAIAAYLAAENGGSAEDYVGGFRGVSFRRSGSGAWNTRK